MILLFPLPLPLLMSLMMLLLLLGGHDELVVIGEEVTLR